MSDLALRSPQPQNVVLLLLSHDPQDTQGEKHQRVQLPPGLRILNGEEENRELLLDMSRQHNARWYIKGNVRLVTAARDLCKRVFEQGNVDGVMHFESWYSTSVNEWLYDGRNLPR
jgi:hypothetical protein